MSFKEITDLRKTGKLEEALEMANQSLEADPGNIWNKRAAAWVYYEFLKKNNAPLSFESFKENLMKIQDLGLPEDDKMVFDSCAWKIGSLVFTLQKENPVNYGKINDLFDIIKGFHFSKPSEAYSFIYKAFHKGYQNWSRYVEFADWWDLDKLRPEDFLKDEVGDQKILSIAEQAYIAYSKKLLEGEAVDVFGHNRSLDQEKIQSFLPKLDSIIETYPQFNYLPYYKGKLLIALGSTEKALSALLPFARQNRNNFWIWSLLAESFPNNSEEALACYCKALSIKSPSKFLVNVRQEIIPLLLGNGFKEEAFIELHTVVNDYVSNGWKVPLKLLNLQTQEWYLNTEVTKKNNREFYLKYAPIAEDLIFGDISESTIVIDHIKSKTGVANFVKDDSTFGNFRYTDLISNLKIGDLLKVKFYGQPKRNKFKVVSAKRISTKTDTDLVKEFFDELHVIEEPGFGFAAGVFIPPFLINGNFLKTGDIVSGKAIRSYNRSKKELGWKAVSIKKD